MTWYSLSAYLSYRRKALTRHGVHSPFVFDFIEQVLRVRPAGTFREQLEQYFGAGHVIWIDAQDPMVWERQYLNTTGVRTPYSVVVVAGVYKTAFHTAIWRSLHERPEVRLSIDLYRYGLLFFRDELREKQHFTLR